MPVLEQIPTSFEDIVAGLADMEQLGNESIGGAVLPFGAELLTDTPPTAARMSLAACIRSGAADSTVDDTTSSGTYDYGIGFDDFNRPSVYEVTGIS